MCATAGGPPALATVLGALPKNFPAAVVVIQHLDDHLVQNMATWLSQQCALPVELAREGDRPTAGTVLLARTAGPPVCLRVPSVGRCFFQQRQPVVAGRGDRRAALGNGQRRRARVEVAARS